MGTRSRRRSYGLSCSTLVGQLPFRSRQEGKVSASASFHRPLAWSPDLIQSFKGDTVTISGRTLHPYTIVHMDAFHICSGAGPLTQSGITRIWSSIPPYFWAVFSSIYLISEEHYLDFPTHLQQSKLTSVYFMLHRKIPPAFIYRQPNLLDDSGSGGGTTQGGSGEGLTPECCRGLYRIQRCSTSVWSCLTNSEFWRCKNVIKCLTKSEFWRCKNVIKCLTNSEFWRCKNVIKIYIMRISIWIAQRPSSKASRLTG